MMMKGIYSFVLMAATLPAYQDPVQTSAPNMGAILLRVVLSLLVVILLAFLAIKFFQRQTPLTRAGRWMRILDQVMIGQNRALLLAEIAGNIYVLGVTDHNIIKLLEIDDPSQVALFTAEDLESKESPSALWKKCLERYLTNRGNRSGDYNKED